MYINTQTYLYCSFSVQVDSYQYDSLLRFQTSLLLFYPPFSFLWIYLLPFFLIKSPLHFSQITVCSAIFLPPKPLLLPHISPWAIFVFYYSESATALSTQSLRCKSFTSPFWICKIWAVFLNLLRISFWDYKVEIIQCLL